MLRAFSGSILGGLGCHVDRKVSWSGSIHSALASTRSFPSLNYESRQALPALWASWRFLFLASSADWKQIYEWKRDHRQNTTKAKVRASTPFPLGEMNVKKWCTWGPDGDATNSSRPVIKDLHVITDLHVKTRRLNCVKYQQDDIPVNHVSGICICFFTLQSLGTNDIHLHQGYYSHVKLKLKP